MLVRYGDEYRELTDLLIEDGVVFLVVLLLCFVADFLMKTLGWFTYDKNGRYFSIHFLINIYVVIVHDPAMAAFSGPCDTKGTMAILALHIFHILAFQPLEMIDWIHHFVMVIVMLPLAWLMRPATLLGHGAFWASGLPGGIDYAMLVMVKRGWLNRITEKRVMAHVSLWLRAPGCLYHALLAWIGLLRWASIDPHHPSNPNTSLLPDWMCFPATFVVMLTFFWNGPFFLRRVIESNLVAEIAERVDPKKD